MGSLKNYQRLRLLGSGSFGQAVLCRGPQGETCVLKCIKLNKMSSQERADAENEARLLRSLKHPYIIEFRDSFIESNALYIAMDFAEGGDLQSAIERKRRAGQLFNEPQITRWFTQAGLALKHLHERHILHRDLKSANLFLTSSGRLKLGDFGISKVLACTRDFAKTSVGTPYYLAPEICRQQPYAFSADIWALGIVLYEMAALRVPFDAANIYMLMEKILHSSPPKLGSHLSSEVRQLCLDLLERDPRRRPNIAQVLAYPVVQREIRAMLDKERQRKDAQKANANPAPGAPVKAAPGAPLSHRDRGDRGQPSSRGAAPFAPLDNVNFGRRGSAAAEGMGFR